MQQTLKKWYLSVFVFFLFFFQFFFVFFFLFCFYIHVDILWDIHIMEYACIVIWSIDCLNISINLL